jgi:Ca2+-binding RTX toxin-like protein
MVAITALQPDVIQTISGTVTQLVRDNEENELDGFILKDTTGEVVVDAEEGVNLTVGEQVTVVGELEKDDGDIEFEALKITKADGIVILNPFETAGAGPNDDIFDGTSGQDTFDGGLGRDFVKGRGGADNLTGGNSADILIGGRGRDSLTGGRGKDKFVYESLKEGGDRITDFNVRQDAIVVDDIFADDRFEEVSGNNLDQFADFLKLTQVGSSTVVRVDSDGTGGSTPFKVLVTLEGVNAANLSVRNFVFDD